MLPKGPGRVVVLGREIRVDVRPGADGGVPPLLLLMGLGGDVETWEPFRSRLAERTGATTVAFDVPGTGASPAGRIPWPLASLGRLRRGLPMRWGSSGSTCWGCPGAACSLSRSP